MPNQAARPGRHRPDECVLFARIAKALRAAENPDTPDQRIGESARLLSIAGELADKASRTPQAQLRHKATHDIRACINAARRVSCDTPSDQRTASLDEATRLLGEVHGSGPRERGCTHLARSHRRQRQPTAVQLRTLYAQAVRHMIDAQSVLTVHAEQFEESDLVIGLRDLIDGYLAVAKAKNLQGRASGDLTRGDLPELSIKLSAAMDVIQCAMREHDDALLHATQTLLARAVQIVSGDCQEVLGYHPA